MNESEVYPCPRCSGVNLTKKFALRKKLRHWSCKKCKGIMLSVDDINKLPFIGSRIIKKHNIIQRMTDGYTRINQKNVRPINEKSSKGILLIFIFILTPILILTSF